MIGERREHERACTSWCDWVARNRYSRNILDAGAAYTFTGPFKCLISIFNCLIMWERQYEGGCTGWGDWGARYRHHRNSLEEGALYTFPQPTSNRVGEESVIRRRPRIFVFSPYSVPFSLLSVSNTKSPVCAATFPQPGEFVIP